MSLNIEQEPEEVEKETVEQAPEEVATETPKRGRNSRNKE